MSAYNTVFNNVSRVATNSFGATNQNQKVLKIRTRMEKKMKFFLQNGDWQEALRFAMMNLNSKQNQQIERRSSDSVVTPDHFKMLLEYDSPKRGQSSHRNNDDEEPIHDNERMMMNQQQQQQQAPTALAHFIRDQAFADDIPNSPSLYSEIVENFCLTHKEPKAALEVAIEGNARWRFGESEKRQMGMTILKQCAQQRNCWSVACDVMDSLLKSSAKKNNGRLSAASAKLSPELFQDDKSKKSSNNSKLIRSSSSSSIEYSSAIIDELLGQAAYNSGMWQSVANRIQKQQKTEVVEGSDIFNNEIDRNIIMEENEDEDKSLILWKACFTAAKEGHWEEALSIFKEVNKSSINNSSEQFDSSSSSLKTVISENALHQILNTLGSLGKWETSVKVMDEWLSPKDTSSQRRITSLASNLVFSSFPSPFIDEEQTTHHHHHRHQNPNDVAVELFDKWMSEVESFTPPPLTAALMVGFWHHHRSSDVDDKERKERMESAVSLLSRFTINEIMNDVRSNDAITTTNFDHPLLHQIDDAAYGALLQARKLLLGEYYPHLNENNSGNFLMFPSPSYDRVIRHQELFDHRAQHWKARKQAIDKGHRSGFFRPGRQDYFPSFGKTSMLGVNDVVKDEEDMTRALRAARAAGQNSFAGADVSHQGDRGSVDGGFYQDKEGYGKYRNSSASKDADDLFRDPRPGPFGQNERTNGYEYYKMGGQAITPGKRASKVASPMHSVAPRRFRGFMNPDRTWKQSTPAYMDRQTHKTYKWGKAI